MRRRCSSFVSRSVSQSLDQQLRRDFHWAAATVDQTPDGALTLDTSRADRCSKRSCRLGAGLEPGRPQLLLQQRRGGATAARRKAQALAMRRPIVIVVGARPTTAPMRILSRRCRIVEPAPVVIQVGAIGSGDAAGAAATCCSSCCFGLPLAVALAGLGGYTLARRALAPVERMTERARSITAERLSDRLPVAQPDDEMGRLATVFNETLARLEASFEQMRQFTADVSHELRTPLTAIRSVGEVGLREHRDDAEYRVDHRQHARGSRSARQPRRPAADAVARRDGAVEAVARRRRSRGARGRGRRAPQRAGRGEEADDLGGVPRGRRTRAPIAWSCGRR